MISKIYSIIGLAISLLIVVSCGETKCENEPEWIFSFANELDSKITIYCDRNEHGHHEIEIESGDVVSDDTIGLAFHYLPWQCNRGIIIADSVVILNATEGHEVFYEWQYNTDTVSIDNRTTEFIYRINEDWLKKAILEMKNYGINPKEK